MTEAVEQAVELGLLVEGGDGIQAHVETVPRQVFAEMIWVCGQMDPDRTARRRSPPILRGLLTAHWPPMLYEFLTSVCHTVLAQNASQDATAYVLLLARDDAEVSLILSGERLAEHFRDADTVASFWAACRPVPLREAV